MYKSSFECKAYTFLPTPKVSNNKSSLLLHSSLNSLEKNATLCIYLSDKNFFYYF